MYSPVPSHDGKGSFTRGDAVVIIILALVIYGMVATASRWTDALQPDFSIDLSLRSLPLYTLYSLFRAIIAYGLSLVFTLIFGYWAAKQKSAERVIMPLLDIGQSVPVLGFLPGLVMGLIALFPHSNFGIELACILLIFTGQVWNMTFSYYSSLKAVPTHFHELSRNVGLTWSQKLRQIELPYAASGLAWNSLMSMAGGWFFLTVCEAFVLGDRNFRLPGLGSFMAVAIDKSDTRAMVAGVIAMVTVIVGMDFVVWRPVVSWTRRFRLDEQQEAVQDIPFMELLLKDSKIVRFFEKFFRSEKAKLENEAEMGIKPIREEAHSRHRRSMTRRQIVVWRQVVFVFGKITTVLLVVVGLWIAAKIYRLVEPLSVRDVRIILKSSGITFLRVIFALALSTLWAVPFGIWIGLSPKLTRTFQPVIQVAASFPAPMLYPLVLFILSALGIHLGWGAGVLMLMGVQWYVLFNVLAGATVISRELQDTFLLIGVSRKERWLNLYLPSIFPSLVTGWVTAAGGAWNASIVAEYIQFRGTTLKTVGLGALINEATTAGNFPMLAGSLIAMVVIVVGLNRTVWRQIYDLVERRFRFER